MFFNEIWHKTSWYDFGQYFYAGKTGEVKGSALVIGAPFAKLFWTNLGKKFGKWQIT